MGVKDLITAKMTGKPKFLFGGEEGTYEDFEKKLHGEIEKARLSTEFKKKSFLYKHLTGSVLDNLTKLIFPTKISEKTFNELLEILKNHYIPNKHLRERVVLYARIQGEEEDTRAYFEDLKSIASRCKYKDDVLKVILCDKTLTGIICPHLRESLFKAGISPSCTAEQYMEYALLFEENIRKEKLARENKLATKKNGKLNINNNIERTPSPNPKKPKSDSPASKFGVSLKKNNDNNNNNKNGTNSPKIWEQKSPLTPQSTFGVTLKSKSTSQVSPKGSPKGSPIPNSDAQKENMFPTLKPILNGTANRSNSMSSPKSNGIMKIPEIMEPVKEPKKAALTPEARKILEKHGFVPKTAQQKERSWSPSPSPEPRKPIAITLEAKKILDKHNQKLEPPKPPPRREPSYSRSPSPEPRDSRSQDTRGRSSIRDATPKLKRSSSNLNIRDKPSINEKSPTNTVAPAPTLKRSSSTISISRNPRPEPQQNVSSNRMLRDNLPVLKSVKNLRPEPEPATNREKFDISDKLPKLRPIGLKQSPSEVLDFLPELPEDNEPRKPTITAETQAILDKYCNKPKNDTPKVVFRREPSYSPSPEPEPRTDLSRKQLFDKYAKPKGPSTPPNKSSPYSDFTKNDIFDQFLAARNSPTPSLKAQIKAVKKPSKKDEAPILTDEDRRKLEEKYGIIRGKPKAETIPEESPKPERKKSPSRAKKSFEIFENKTQANSKGVVKASDRVVQMYNESQQAKAAFEDAAHPANQPRSNGITPTTPTEKPLITIKASPKIAEMYKAQVEKRDKTRCPSPTEKVNSSITKYATEKKWTSTIDLSSTKTETVYDAAYFKREALKINAKELQLSYKAELDYGDSLLKVSEKDAFSVKIMRADLFPQENKKPESPGPNRNADYVAIPSANRKTDSPGPTVIPPKPGSAAAAKPQFDIASFFGGSSYDDFLKAAKSGKGGGQ